MIAGGPVVMPDRRDCGQPAVTLSDAPSSGPGDEIKCDVWCFLVLPAAISTSDLAVSSSSARRSRRYGRAVSSSTR